MREPAKNADSLHILRIETNRRFAPIVEAGLEYIGIDVITWYESERDSVRFEVCHSSRDAADAQLAELRPLLDQWSDNDTWSVEVSSITNADWSEYWKRFFHVTEISPRITIKPSWESHASAPGEIVVELDPGMTFGTGHHFTTASCLRFIDQLAGAPSPGSLADIGCGSGILSIAAAKLGFSPILAFDNHDDAVRIARENAARNRVTKLIEYRTLDVNSFRPEQPFDLVVANLQALLLEQAAPVIASAVARPRGRLVVAGILTPQYEPVRAAFERCGCAEIQALHDHEWTTGLFGPQNA